MATALALTALAASAAAQDEIPVPIPRAGVMKMSVPLRVVPVRVDCVLAGAFPVLEARVESPVTVEKARLRFRPAAYPLWYEVALKSTAEGGHAVLPKPRPSVQRIHYYFEVTIPGGRARSPEVVATVVEEASQCPGTVAPAVDAAYIPVVVPRGAPAVPPVPPGFIPAGAVTSGPAAGRRAAKKSLLVAGGLSALAAGVVVAIPSPSGQSTFDGQSSSDPSTVTFIDSHPPPGSTLSVGSGAMMSVRVSLDARRTIGRGQWDVLLYRGSEGTGSPCAVVVMTHLGYDRGERREVVVSGALQQARPCQPSDRMRILLREGSVLRTAVFAENPATYFLVP